MRWSLVSSNGSAPTTGSMAGCDTAETFPTDTGG